MKISSTHDLKKLSEKIYKIILPGDFIFLHGEIGVGKTTFARIVINNYEKKNNLKESEILSPTYNIVFEYKINDFVIKHYDLYRLESEKDINNVGLFENFQQSIIIVEWPELIKKKPLNRIDIFFEYSNDLDERNIIIKTSGRLSQYDF